MTTSKKGYLLVVMQRGGEVQVAIHQMSRKSLIDPGNCPVFNHSQEQLKRHSAFNHSHE
jgi:hypothetical protein